MNAHAQIAAPTYTQFIEIRCHAEKILSAASAAYWLEYVGNSTAVMNIHRRDIAKGVTDLLNIGANILPHSNRTENATVCLYSADGVISAEDVPVEMEHDLSDDSLGQIVTAKFGDHYMTRADLVTIFGEKEVARAEGTAADHWAEALPDRLAYEAELHAAE